MAELSEPIRMLRRVLIYPLQAILIYTFIYLMRLLPFRWASNIGGRLAKIIGPFTRGEAVARRNLAHAFPDKPKVEIDQIIAGMWDNLGRIVGEWAQVDLIDTVGPESRVEVVGAEILLAAHKSGKSFIVFSAHMANWEIALLVASQRGVQMGSIYRAASNPWIDKLIIKFRGKFCSELIPKGREGAKHLLKVLKENRPLALLVDQKLNEGLPIKFFGRDVMTTPAPAELALRLDLPLIPTRLERLPEGRFRVTIMPPMELPNTGERKQDVLTLLGQMNGLLEEWITERPDQWFWVHNRWPD